MAGKISSKASVLRRRFRRFLGGGKKKRKTYSAISHHEITWNKSLNGLFFLLNMAHPQKFKGWPLAESENTTSSPQQLDWLLNHQNHFFVAKKTNKRYREKSTLWHVTTAIPQRDLQPSAYNSAGPRYGTVVACNYQTPTLREYPLSRVRKRTREKRCHNLSLNGEFFS